MLVAHIICKRTRCRHNQSEGCICSVVVLVKQHIPDEVAVGYLVCERYERRPADAKREREAKEGGKQC